MSKQNNGCTSLSYQYQHSYLLQHCHERKENTAIPRLTSTLLTNFLASKEFFRSFSDLANEYGFS